MRVCIYKTDDALDLTLFLREGLTLPGDELDRNWFPLKTVTQGELRADIPEKMSRTGCCVERLGRIVISSRPPEISPMTRRISHRWLGFTNSSKS